jgi:hypothetical protein
MPSLEIIQAQSFLAKKLQAGEKRRATQQVEKIKGLEKYKSMTEGVQINRLQLGESDQ